MFNISDDDSHEMSSLILLEKTKQKHSRMSSILNGKRLAL